MTDKSFSHTRRASGFAPRLWRPLLLVAVDLAAIAGTAV
jgi:hypothetical protein